MTEKQEYTASVRRKGLENTGVTPDIAKKMYGTQGRTTVAIVELRHKRQINDDDTGRSVELVIEALEPSQDDKLDEHLRQLMRTMHQGRVLNSEDGQLAIDTQDDLEPSVEKIIAARQADTDPYTYVHAKGGRDKRGAETPCGLKADADKTLTTHVDADQITCPECLAILAEEAAGS